MATLTSNRRLGATDRIDFDRFLGTLDRSSQIGVGRENGLSRLALSDSDRQMRDVLVGWCEQAGLRVTIDRMGSIFARREGTENLPPVLIGSHLDTQVNGGRFDGVLGVLGGLEMLRRLDDLGIETRRPIELVDWTNEEGARFSPPMIASGCFAGAYKVDWAHARSDEGGVTLGEALERIGYTGAEPVGGREVDSYFELHIEQAATLAEAAVEVGVVTHGYSSHGLLAEFAGATAHTGPQPMEERRNALVAGARLLSAVDDIGWAHAVTGGKATGARLIAWPNTAGILSDWAQVVCDVRHDDPEVSAGMRRAMLEALDRMAARTRCEARILDEWHWGGHIFDDALVGLIRETAAALGYSHRDLPSQAGHDAYFMARVAPTAMIFTPCVGGISHSNFELVTPEQMEPGLNVLLHAAVARADRA